MLLDLGLPDRDGLGVIADIRAKGQTPIVVLSAREAPAMKVEALDLGADDYVQKPFGVEELLARLRAGLRHAVQARGSAPVVRTGDLEIDLGLRQVTKGPEALKLSPKEYDLLAELALNLGRTVSHKDLLAAVWGSDRAEIQYLRVYVGQLRQKLGTFAGAPLLVSDPGVGYRLAVLIGPVDIQRWAGPPLRALSPLRGEGWVWGCQLGFAGPGLGSPRPRTPTPALPARGGGTGRPPCEAEYRYVPES